MDIKLTVIKDSCLFTILFLTVKSQENSHVTSQTEMYVNSCLKYEEPLTFSIYSCLFNKISTTIHNKILPSTSPYFFSLTRNSSDDINEKQNLVANEIKLFPTWRQKQARLWKIVTQKALWGYLKQNLWYTDMFL
jgi:hypothetical protein